MFLSYFPHLKIIREMLLRIFLCNFSQADFRMDLGYWPEFMAQGELRKSDRLFQTFDFRRGMIRLRARPLISRKQGGGVTVIN
jgi:hypothetical protein